MVLEEETKKSNSHDLTKYSALIKKLEEIKHKKMGNNQDDYDDDRADFLNVEEGRIEE